MRKKSTPLAPIELFYSYADADTALLNELDKHLSLLQREGLIVTFHKRLISPGMDWRRDLNQHLNTASVILLLISADFMASNYCYGIEMQRAVERHNAGEAYVIPILLRPVDWKSAPFGKLQVLPSNGRAITEWQDPDAAFDDISQSIRSILQRLIRSLERTSPSFKTTIFRLSLVFLAASGLIASFFPSAIVAQVRNSFLQITTSMPSGPTSVVGLFLALGLILLITVTIDPVIYFFKRRRYLKKFKKRDI